MMLPLIAFNAMAGNWAQKGHWEFAEIVDYNDFPDPRWKRTVVFDVYDSSPESQSEVRSELKQISQMTNSKSLTENYNKLIRLSKAEANRLINASRIPKKNIRFDEAYNGIMKNHIMLFSHKLNGDSSGDLYSLFESFSSLKEQEFKKEWIKCSRNNDDNHSFNSNRTCSAKKIPHMSSAELIKIERQFQKLYGFNPARSSFVLYNPKTTELMVARYGSNTPDHKVTLYPMYVNTGKRGEPMMLTQFRY